MELVSFVVVVVVVVTCTRKENEAIGKSFLVVNFCFIDSRVLFGFFFTQDFNFYDPAFGRVGRPFRLGRHFPTANRSAAWRSPGKTASISFSDDFIKATLSAPGPSSILLQNQTKPKQNKIWPD